jgi:UDP-N-acetylmuramoylalanine--D-glutamate ligase
MRWAIGTFTGVEHRLELVRVLDGVQYVNDSIATAPERALAAINAFDEPLILLAGGKDKDMVWDAWAEEAVQVAVETAVPGDVVLLSPGGTSFDAFTDFAERGEAFRQLVKEL